MSPEEPTHRSGRIKKRKVTACGECHRRKQKCNRQKPCNFCIDRGVTHKCVYRSYSESGRSLSPRSEAANSPRRHGQDETAQSLSHTLGYARDAPEDATPANHLTTLPSSNAPEGRKLNSLQQKLPGAATMQVLIAVFFSEANWYFTVLDRHHFDLDYRRWLSGQQPTQDAVCFPALLFQVLAAACQFVPRHLAPGILRSTESRSLDDLSRQFSETGEKFLNVLGRHSLAITAVEADLMRCAWLKNCGRGTEAWYSLANSVRQAQDQRLHQEPRASTDLTSQWYAEHKRRLWATIFTWEAHMALQLGRARMINLADCTIQCPLDCDMPATPSRTLVAMPGPDDAPSHYTSAVIKYRLSCLIHELMNIGAFRPDQAHYGDVIRAQEKVDHMVATLPPAVRNGSDADTSWDLRYPELVRHRLQISVITNSFLLSLHRPHIAQHPESLNAAITAANMVLAKSQSLFEITEPHHYKTHTNTFYTVDTAMLLSAIVATLPPDHPQREPSLLAIRQAIRRLGVLKSRNPAAVAGEKALTKFLDKLGESSVIEASPAEEPSRPVSFGTTSPLSTDPMQTMRSLLNGPEPRDSDAPRVYNSAQASLLDSAIFTQIMTDSAYTATWLESTNGFSPASMVSFAGQYESPSDLISTPF